MFIRDSNMNMIELHRKDYTTEKQFYTILWKIKYDISFPKNSFTIAGFKK